MIRLEKINADNYQKVFDLELVGEQENFVSSNMRSLAQAWVFYERAKPYAIYNDDPRIIHNGLRQGYVDIVMENIDAYTYSPIYETEIYDYTLNTSNGTELLLINYGDTICLPTIYVQIISGNSFSIINYSNGGQELKFNDLVVNEELTIDCENEEIETDLPLTYRYDNHNGVFLELIRGNNYLKVFGNIKLKFKMQFKTFQG